MYSLQKSCHNRKNDYKKAKHTLIHTDVDGDKCKSFPLEFKMNAITLLSSPFETLGKSLLPSRPFNST